MWMWILGIATLIILGYLCWTGWTWRQDRRETQQGEEMRKLAQQRMNHLNALREKRRQCKEVFDERD